MQVGVIGANFKTADLHLREELTRALTSLEEVEFSFPFVILSTCNRSEIYFSGENLAKAHSEILSHLRSQSQIHKLYSYFGKDCFTHLCRVSSGLDSAIFMETEIQRQVKISYQKIAAFRPLSSSMHYLFQKSLRVAKKIRNTLSMQKVPSLEQTIWQTAHFFLKDIRSLNILFIGFSQTNRQIFSYFKRKGVKNISFASRFFACKAFCEQNGLTFAGWGEEERFFAYDIVIVASHSKDFVIHKDDFPEGSKKMTLIFDLSVPRLVDPVLGSIPFINLLNMEKLEKFVLDKKTFHREKMLACETLLQDSVERLVKIYARKQRYQKELSLAIL